MKQTNNAIKFLMAQYRAIFNNAYFKGLATAALVTVAMAAGQAQANPTDLSSSLVDGNGTPVDIVTSGDSTLNASGDKAIAKSITVNACHTLTTSGSLVSIGDLTLNSGSTLTVSGGQLLLGTKDASGNVAYGADLKSDNGTLNLSGGNIGVLNSGSTLTVSGGQLLLGTKDASGNVAYGADLKSDNGTLNLSGGNIGVKNFDVKGGIITLTSGGKGDTNLTAYGKPVVQDGARPSGPLPYNAVGNLTNVTATVNSGTNISAVGALTVTGGTIALNGASGSGTFAYVQGSSTALFDKTAITASGTGNFLFSRDLQLKDATVKVSGDGSVAVLGGVYDVSKFEDSGSKATAEANKITITNGTFTTESGSTLNFGYDAGSKTEGTFTTESGSTLNFGYDAGSKTELTLNGEVKFTNPESGSITFYTPKVVVEKAATLKELSNDSGSVVFNNASGTKLVVNEAVDLAKLEIISGDGTLQKLSVSGGTLTLASDSVTLGTAYAADKLAVEAKTLTLGSGDFTQSNGSINVSESLVGGGKYTISGGTLNLNATANGTVTKVSGFELVSGSTASKLEVTGAWDFGTATLTANQSGTATFTKANISNIGKIDVKDSGSVSLVDQSVLVGTDLAVVSGGSFKLDNSNAQFTGAVTTNVSGAKVELANNAKIQFKYAEANKSGSNNEGLGKLTIDGTSTLALVDSGKTEIKLSELKKEKEKFFSGAGLFELAGVKVTETGVAEDGTIAYDKAQSGAGISGIYEDATVTGVSGNVANSNDWGAAQLASGSDTLTLQSGAALTLNGVNGNLVTKDDGKTAAGVTLASGSTLSVQSNGGTLDSISTAKDQGKVLVGADLVVNKDIGASGSSVAELSVQKAGNTQVQNVYANVLNVDGKLEVAKNVALSGASTVNGFLSAQDITSSAGTLDVQGQVEANKISVSGAVTIGGSVVADELKITASSATVQVGDADSSGLLDLGSLDLNSGSLLIDPSFDLDASVVAIKDVTDTTKDIVSVNGDIGVGMNSVLGIGLDAASAKELVTNLGYLQNGKLQKDGVGAVLVVDNTLSIASGDKVIIDPTKDHAGLNTAITGASGDTLTLAKGAGLVITDNMTTQSVAGTAVISFVNSGTASFTAEYGSVIAFDKALTAADKVQLTNTTNVTTTGATITAANGLLVGTNTSGSISFTLDTKAADKLYNQSTPIKDFTLSAIKGDFNANRAEAGVDYVLLTSGLNGGQAIEATSRLAVYGGSVQATNLAQQAATDAVVDRMSRANPNGSLVFANNAQGGGLWLSPVYKSHESDSFDADGMEYGVDGDLTGLVLGNPNGSLVFANNAQGGGLWLSPVYKSHESDSFDADGVDYGVDGDLTGLVLGADSTTESGVRVGGYFNFGSADFDGQGISEQVSSEADYFGFGLYAGMTFGQMSLVADAGFTQVSNDVEQNTGYAKYSTVTADVDSTAVTLGLRGEYKLNVATMDVTPHLGVRYTRLAIDSYDAKSAGKVLATTDVDTMQMFSVPFGVTISKDIAAGSWTIKPVFDLTLTANAGDTDAKLDTTFIGATPVALTSEAFDSFTYGATMGIDAKYGENFSIGLNTNYVGSSNADEFGVMGNVRYMF